MKHVNFYAGLFALITLFSCNSDNVVKNEPSANEGQISLPAQAPEYTSVPVEGQYIVVLNENALGNAASRMDVQGFSKTMMQKYEVEITEEQRYFSNRSFQGFTARLDAHQLNKMSSDPMVKYVEQDQMITLAPMQTSEYVATASQTIPYGTTRVGGGKSASPYTAWVIDTGIQMNRPDLNVDASRSKSFVGWFFPNPNDQNGHGTHVAGTIAAKDNDIGTVGVAPGTTVVAVRVLDRNGSGTISQVINGVNYVGNNARIGDVANMSLGGANSTALDDAVKAAASKGIVFAVAAGNEAQNANNVSPARVNAANVYAISAMDQYDRWAYFSNFGSAVDFCAPGVSVTSTWLNSGYNTISGTSMATPHAAGVLLFGSPSTDGVVQNDPDGVPDPIIHI
ncbi:S8 family peptidase [Persicobacter diffluens]|uniref:Peptidase S8 n=1 Tax=Persicobacter diffluens TaxID=981 RepID=A0AAN5ALH3_9BACT|nr:hypothetical protein PEDI_38010 [Persicobacter diffluens]